MRLFLAIELPPRARGHLAGVRDRLRASAAEANWTRERNLHVTLKFLGETPDEEVARLCDALGEVAADQRAGWTLEASGLECFPPRGHVRIIAAAMGGQIEAIRKLHEAVEGACFRLGYRREGRDYRPHVTLGRARRRPMKGAVRPELEKRALGSFPGPRFAVDQFVLMESRQVSDGMEYTVAARFDLAKSQ